MWSFRAWRRQRLLKRYPIAPELWAQVLDSLPLLDGLEPQALQLLQERAVLFLHAKRLTPLPGVTLEPFDRLRLAAMAELPLLALSEKLEWYQGFHEVLIYPEDFLSPQKYRDPSGVEHEWDAEHSGEAWLQGPVILAWPGVHESGGWEGYNLVIHELAHKLDMLNGDANGLPPLHGDMRIEEWARVMQAAYDALNATLDRNPHAHTPIDPYAAENPAEFFAVTSEYFFSAPDLLEQALPEVYGQLRSFYRQDPLARLRCLRQRHPEYADGPGPATG
ncbi:zinc-dependent peptidase [Stutzerimonas kirkiae]|uniref:Zinc-dependent peptidase n=1 Tax=Stutzerimonas kirkiae TaxID=2211392 RepID=A0A4Q9RAK0_9GAMM|nr:M90 family metallopeptidase [Stutzerimonas kirkiae]TBU97781.1 zinc-dependent peptidase [Stutzerimonas kirkiae]TBV04868.1 zinc-dependent peptidase [Stutzerimonas kirkiae]TBV12004.1 zinc-dependent peptidase [Stutzerimonas kirkiae]TBV14987.1 zinc-dependent peptidase [Stutzerimonas kirkiae]